MNETFEMIQKRLLESKMSPLKLEMARRKEKKQFKKATRLLQQLRKP
jgi:hypothetical protein